MMMPDRGQSPADQWYYKQPTDRTAISQQKIDQLQVCLVFRPKKIVLLPVSWLTHQNWCEKVLNFSLWAKTFFLAYQLMCSMGKKNKNHWVTASATSCRKDEKLTFWYVLCHLFDSTSTSDSFLSCVHSLPIWFLSSVVDINMITF